MEDRILVLAEFLLAVKDFLYEPGLFCVCGEVRIIGEHDGGNPADGHIGDPGTVDEDIQDRGLCIFKSGCPFDVQEFFDSRFLETGNRRRREKDMPELILQGIGVRIRYRRKGFARFGRDRGNGAAEILQNRIEGDGWLCGDGQGGFEHFRRKCGMEEFCVQKPDKGFLLGMTENGQKPVYGAAGFIVVLAGRCIQSKHRFGERDEGIQNSDVRLASGYGEGDVVHPGE